MEPRVLVGASQLGWVTNLTQWVSEHGGAQLVGQALTAGDVESAEFDVLVLDSWSSLLSRRLVDRVQAEGAAVIVLINSARPDDESNRLRELGVSLSLPISASPEAVVGRAAEVAAVRRFTDRRPTPAPESDSAQPSGNDQRLMALLGHDGVTEVAVNLAAAMGRVGNAVLLADFDTVNPSIAQRLGLPLVPNLLTASDHIRQSRFDSSSVVQHESGFAVAPGLANPREWDELTSVETGELASAFRELFSVTLAVIHPMLEALAPMSGLEGRFDVGRRILEICDEVMLVASASPVGLVRALGSVADLRGITPAPVHLVVNRAPRDPFRRTEWARELERSFLPESLTFLPLDHEVPKAAWDGRLLQRGPLVRRVRKLTGQLAGVGTS